MMVDFEQTDCIERDEDESFEMIQVPDYEDPYGGENCPCRCHGSQKLHCTICGVKYINGRVYLQHGKVIRPAKVIFEKEDQEKVMEMKWRVPGEPEIGYGKNMRKSYFLSPIKEKILNRVEHCGKLQKSPRTPKAKSSIRSKSLRPSSSVKRDCANRTFSLFESIEPLDNKSDVIKDDEAEIKHSNLLLEKSQNKDDNITMEEKKDEVELIDFGRNSDKLELEKSEVTTVEENIFAEQDETKFSIYSQIPSVISPMSFYNSESLHSMDLDSCVQSFSQKSEDSILSLSKTSNDFIKDGSMNVSDSTANKEEDVNLNLSLKGECKEGVTANIDIDQIVIENKNHEDSEKESISKIIKESIDGVVSATNDDFKKETIDCQNSFNLMQPNNYFFVSNIDKNKCLLNTTQENKVNENTDENNCVLHTAVENRMDENIDEKKYSLNTQHENKVENNLEKHKYLLNIVQENKIDEKITNANAGSSKENMETQILHQYKLQPNFSSGFNSQIESFSEGKKDISTQEMYNWTKEEDKIILQAFQLEGDTKATLMKINQLLPLRSIEEIQKRFQVLLQLLQRMTSATENSGK
uniref:Myb-like domain-containing protein n=2 Tax=Clastoptera arizonana TaxID=38151 RepID=A0A1B6D7L8_9HEMI